MRKLLNKLFGKAIDKGICGYQPTHDVTSAPPSESIDEKELIASLRKKLAILKTEKTELEKAMADSETVLSSASKALQLAKHSYKRPSEL